MIPPATDTYDGGDAAIRPRCTHLSLHYARGNHPERVQKENTIRTRVTGWLG